MIKRIKYGCFALLFITTLTLSSIVAILASSNADVDNSLYLTYTPVTYATLRAGYWLNQKLGDAKTITFDFYTEENLAIIENASSSESVASDGSDDILMYDVEGDYYVLSSSIIQVTSVGDTFSNLSNLTAITFNNFDTSTAGSYWDNIFLGTSVETLDLSGWDTSNAGSMFCIFNGCSKLKTLDLTGWDVSNAYDMTGLFADCTSLTTIYADSDWCSVAVNVDDLSEDMFQNCTSLVGGNGTKFNSSYSGLSYARVDTAGTPGYFTLKTS